MELYNFLLMYLLFSSVEAVQDGIQRCHTLWLFCAGLPSHFPSLLPSLLHSKSTKPLLTLNFPDFAFMVLGPFHLLSLPQRGVPKAEGSSCSWSLERAASLPYVLQRSSWKISARKLLGHTDRACVPATTSDNSLAKIALFHLEPCKDSWLMHICWKAVSDFHPLVQIPF